MDTGTSGNLTYFHVTPPGVHTPAASCCVARRSQLLTAYWVGFFTGVYVLVVGAAIVGELTGWWVIY